MNSFCGIADVRGETLDFKRLQSMGKELTEKGAERSQAYIDKGVGIFCVGRGAPSQPYYLIREKRKLCVALDGKASLLDGTQNHSASESDSPSTLAEAYLSLGYDTPKALDGSFSFAVFECSKRELFLASDPQKCRAIYIYKNGEKIIFSTKIKALLRYSASCGEVDKRAIIELIRSPDGTLSAKDIYKNISVLSGGKYMIFSGLGAQTLEYSPQSTAAKVAESASIQRLIPDKSLDLQRCTEEMLFAFDYPQFSELTPEYIAAIRTASTNSSRIFAEEERHCLSEEYSLRKAYTLGRHFGVDVTPVITENSLNIKKSHLTDREKQLSKIVSAIFTNEQSHVKRLFGASLETIVSKDANVSERIGILGKIIGLERWLESYPIVPV